MLRYNIITSQTDIAAVFQGLQAFLWRPNQVFFVAKQSILMRGKKKRKYRKETFVLNLSAVLTFIPATRLSETRHPNSKPHTEILTSPPESEIKNMWVILLYSESTE